MILDNVKSRLLIALDEANSTNINKEVSFIYNELLTHDTISSVFYWLFKQGIDFATRHEEYRFVIIIHPN